MDHPWLKSLAETLLTDTAVRIRLSRRALKAELDSSGLIASLRRISLEPDAVCAQALAAVLPLMSRFAPEPDGGWLRAAYEYLSAQLYPVENAPAPDCGAVSALECYLTVLHACMAHEQSQRAYDPLTDILFATPEERAASSISAEYDAFVQAVTRARYLELLRLGRACMPFDPLAHNAGVHHIAVHTARQAARCGVPVDVALVSAAALSHDIGKFGCRGEDLKRIPYLHYYYTNQWLLACGLPHIAQIASNHSTWDLEFDNLPVESLLLIYADFRVRGTRDEQGREHTRIYTLRDAGDVIFHKLSDMVPEKRLRYSRVYHKLCDFEEYLMHLGVNPDPLSDRPLPAQSPDIALLPDAGAVDALARMAMAYNIRLMHAFTVNESFDRLLERAGSEKNLGSIRTYLHLFEEYCPYMTRAHKLQTLNFLYELLMHAQSDVRRQAGRLMGRILSNAGLQYRKELPENAPETAIAPTLSQMFAETEALWRSFLAQLLMPDPAISRKHAIRIVNSLKVVVDSLFANCRRTDIRIYLNPLLEQYTPAPAADRFVLADSIVHVPLSELTSAELSALVDFLRPMLLNGILEQQVCALQTLSYFTVQRPEEAAAPVRTLLLAVPVRGGGIAARLHQKLLSQVGGYPAPLEMPESAVSDIFLMNFKSGAHWIVKLANIDALVEYARCTPAGAFHVATHLSNLLLVSEHLPVREKAGQALVRLADLLSVDQLNELTVDLCRGLERSQQEFSRYVPPALSHLILCLPTLEQEEMVDTLERMVRSGSTLSASAALTTLGALLVGLLRLDEPADALSLSRQERLIGLLMAGLAHFDEDVHRTAMTVLCRDICSESGLSLTLRRRLFMQFAKKTATILAERADQEITFYNTTAMLNHLYRLIIDCRVSFGPFTFPAPGSVAFFPGTFDPFSSGHKRIVTEIRSLGIEVYLAVDEFSWSKRTQPKLLRRQIAMMSVADCAGVYLFPDAIPVNLANPEDLARLKALFPGRQLFLVAGSDVIENASAYADPTIPGCACQYDHILFSRSRSGGDGLPQRPPAQSRLTGQVIELSLPTYYEDVSSSRIRESIDKNLEIAMLVDPVVESFIHENGLYLRAPQDKAMLRPENHVYVAVSSVDELPAQALSALPDAFAGGLRAALRKGNARALLLCARGEKAALAAVYAHTAGAAQLLSDLSDVSRAEYVRMHTSGRILILDDAAAAAGLEDALPDLINELLTGSLREDHTYALYRSRPENDSLAALLPAKGFLPVDKLSPPVLLADMRAPVVITLDVFSQIKQPLCSDPAVVACVLAARKRLLDALCRMFPGELVLSFDTGRMSQALVEKVQQCNGVLGLPEKPRRLGPCMCVPFGKIMTDAVVPNTVTKSMHVEKVFESDIRHFSIREEPGYSPLPHQVQTIRSFRRPVLLVDDLLHNGYRMEKLNPLFTDAGLEIREILVGILSGRGRDLMAQQGRSVDAVYWIPNLKYWFTESLLYPFIGGDSVVRASGAPAESSLPSINLLLPYKSPDYLHEISGSEKRRFSMVALHNACEILHTLEQRHQVLFRRSLTLARLGEALEHPRLPDRGRSVQYDRGMPASAVLRDDMEWLARMGE